jgi:ribosome maturation factor RimP
LSVPDDYRTRQLIEDVEFALHYGEWVYVACKKLGDLSGHVTSATRQSFTIQNEGKKHRVQIADVLLFDFPNL